ncbi:hypothetical protein CTAYLR_009733 [Chrysophaeum taylorii]|uniref:tRNA-uridine aminocarboxypropyltransferase n=1 Tax=Chrysophaeum taylorii TaxID=2483200 RepID=A0AAD7UHG9_9STRA|nr:hypothetical protein CTAYLR_009733 [Chrysophaeum taylorii]
MGLRRGPQRIPAISSRGWTRAQAGTEEVVAVDWSRVAVNKLRARAKALGCCCGLVALCADVTEPLPVRGQFDAVVVVFCDPKNGRRAEMFRNAASRLRPGGLALVELFGDQIISHALLASELPGFDPLICRDVERVVLEGPYHASPEPRQVAQVLARAPGPDPAFCRAIDDIFRRCDGEQDEEEEEEEEDLMLSRSAAIARAACRSADETGRCRYCWAAPCCCQPAQPAWWATKVTVVCHPAEFLRSTSTGRLAASVSGARFRLWHEFAAAAAGAKDLTVLYPAPDATSVVDATGPLVVLDGSWRQTAAMLASLRRTGRRVTCVALEDATSAPPSPVIDALHEGAGKGRLSTLEAIALAVGGGRECRRVLAPFVDALRREKKKTPPIVPPPAPAWQLETWIAKLQSVARDAYEPSPARYCPLCDATLASPNRMRSHVAGRRHCAALATRYLLLSDDTTSSPRTVFRRFSSPATRVEPPDAAVFTVCGGR